MNQLALMPALPISVEWHTIRTMGAKLDHGLSEAHYVEADNGFDYIAKGIGFGPRQSLFGPSNELISALIGRETGVPLNEFALLNYRDTVMFGSRWIPQGLLGYCFRDQQLRDCRNAEDAHRIVPFDVFICNTDRHPRNLLIQQQREARRPNSSILIANDHDRCILPEQLTPEDLDAFWATVPPERFIRSAVLRNSLTDADLLDEAVRVVENLPDEAIAAAVRTVPESWLGRPHKRQIREFLLRRRSQVRGIVGALVTTCPNFREGAFK